MRFLNITLATFSGLLDKQCARGSAQDKQLPLLLSPLEHRRKDIFGYFYTTQSRR